MGYGSLGPMNVTNFADHKQMILNEALASPIIGLHAFLLQPSTAITAQDINTGKLACATMQWHKDNPRVAINTNPAQPVVDAYMARLGAAAKALVFPVLTRDDRKTYGDLASNAFWAALESRFGVQGSTQSVLVKRAMAADSSGDHATVMEVLTAMKEQNTGLQGASMPDDEFHLLVLHGITDPSYARVAERLIAEVELASRPGFAGTVPSWVYITKEVADQALKGSFAMRARHRTPADGQAAPLPQDLGAAVNATQLHKGIEQLVRDAIHKLSINSTQHGNGRRGRDRDRRNNNNSDRRNTDGAATGNNRQRGRKQTPQGGQQTAQDDAGGTGDVNFTFCSRCGKKGHALDACYGNPANKNRPTCGKCGMRNHRTDQCRAKQSNNTDHKRDSDSASDSDDNCASPSAASSRLTGAPRPQDCGRRGDRRTHVTPPPVAVSIKRPHPHKGRAQLYLPPPMKQSELLSQATWPRGPKLDSPPTAPVSSATTRRRLTRPLSRRRGGMLDSGANVALNSTGAGMSGVRDDPSPLFMGHHLTRTDGTGTWTVPLAKGITLALRHARVSKRSLTDILPLQPLLAALREQVGAARPRAVLEEDGGVITGLAPLPDIPVLVDNGIYYIGKRARKARRLARVQSRAHRVNDLSSPSAPEAELA